MLGFKLALLIFMTVSLITDCSSFDVLSHARQINLRLNSKMHYSNAVKPPIEVTEAIHELCGDERDDQNLLQALLFLSCGALDNAHDIVQRSSCCDARYVHALIHRLEGAHTGENRMLGWSNSDYWNDQIGNNHPNFKKIYQLVELFAKSDATFTGSELIQRFTTRVVARGTWDPQLFLTLCIDAFKINDEKCIKFCELITTEEFRLLLNIYCKNSERKCN